MRIWFSRFLGQYNNRLSGTPYIGVKNAERSEEHFS
jgi:hypothetical protein